MGTAALSQIYRTTSVSTPTERSTSETIYIDGGMCANPYRIARYARMLELDQQEVLENVVMSRAFTVYQLSTLLQRTA